MPIVLKGIATAEDAILAYESGVQGIVLSNHGGRQLDTARSGLEVLVEVVAALKAKGYYPDPKFEIFVDGGVRRASDVLKAIALGAKAVGVGRPFLYAFCAYGQEGVEKAIQIFRVREPLLSQMLGSVEADGWEQDEFEMNMRLLGARTLAEVRPEMVDASSLQSHIVAVPGDRLYDSNCECSSSSCGFDCPRREHGLISCRICRREHAARPLAGGQVEDVTRRYNPPAFLVDNVLNMCSRCLALIRCLC